MKCRCYSLARLRGEWGAITGNASITRNVKGCGERMIFETKNGVYWPIDESAHAELQDRGFQSPLDAWAYDALCNFLREDQRNVPELWDRENPFCLENPER